MLKLTLALGRLNWLKMNMSDFLVTLSQETTQTTREDVFDTPTEESWWYNMDTSTQIWNGCVHIVLPRSTNTQNILVTHRGWGDGRASIISGFNPDDTLVRIHFTFFKNNIFEFPLK